MKTLELNQMENVNGSWSWEACATGGAFGVLTSVQTGAVIYGGPWAMLGGAVLGCIGANLG